MITVPELAADALGSFLTNYMQRRFGSSEQLVELVPSVARVALECIGNSDALYHNVEHTMLVTLAGHDILRGRALHARMLAADYAHLIIGCLTHDIGYVRGIVPGDDDDGYVINSAGDKIKLPRGSSDAALLQQSALATTRAGEPTLRLEVLRRWAAIDPRPPRQDLRDRLGLVKRAPQGVTA
mgnify:CR=1 FL=1